MCDDDIIGIQPPENPDFWHTYWYRIYIINDY